MKQITIWDLHFCGFLIHSFPLLFCYTLATLKSRNKSSSEKKTATVFFPQYAKKRLPVGKLKTKYIKKA